MGGGEVEGRRVTRAAQQDYVTNERPKRLARLKSHHRLAEFYCEEAESDNPFVNRFRAGQLAAAHASLALMERMR